MKKQVFVYLFLFFAYYGIAQNVEGSWIVFADNGMSELSINEADQVIGLERYDEAQRPSGKRNDLEMVATLKKKGYKLYVGKLPEQEKYISLCFFETGEEGSVKLFIKERMDNLEEAKSFEKISNLGVRLYRKDKFKEIQSLKSIESLTKKEAIKSLEMLLEFGSKEVKKHDDLGYDSEVYFVSEICHNLIKLGYNPFEMGMKLEDAFDKFEEDEKTKELMDKVEAMFDKGERKIEEGKPQEKKTEDKSVER